MAEGTSHFARQNKLVTVSPAGGAQQRQPGPASLSLWKYKFPNSTRSSNGLDSALGKATKHLRNTKRPLYTNSSRDKRRKCPNLRGQHHPDTRSRQMHYRTTDQQHREWKLKPPDKILAGRIQQHINRLVSHAEKNPCSFLHGQNKREVRYPVVSMEAGTALGRIHACPGSRKRKKFASTGEVRNPHVLPGEDWPRPSHPKPGRTPT